MADETTTEWAFKGVVILLFTLGWWLWNKLVNAVERITKDVRVLDKSMSDYKLDAEMRFAKDGHVSETFDRLNGTLNVLQNAINTNTNMTSVINEKINSISEKINNKN